MTVRSRARTALGLLSCSLLAASCTYSSGPSQPTTSPSRSSSSSPLVPSDSVLPTSPSTTPKASPTKPTSTTSKSGLPECVAASLQVRAIQGGAIAGREIAAISFTNISAKACELYGYPGVSLLLTGVPLGKPAQRTGPSPAPVLLAPGAEAQARLSDDSSCQAAVSDTVRIYPPDQTTFVDRPLEMRGCTLYINAFALAD
ncbi:MAG: DUF4232 domain-containing protein [Jatrophihabitantaceae bacterium]